MEYSRENTKALIGYMRAERHSARADYMQAMSDRIAALEAESKTREVSEAEIAAYALQAFGEKHHLINGHSEDLNTCSYPTCVNLAESITALRHTATTPDKESEAVDAESLAHDAAEAEADANSY